MPLSTTHNEEKIIRDIIKSMISAGDYRLSNIQRKVKKLHIMEDLTEEQVGALLILASGSVSADADAMRL